MFKSRINSSLVFIFFCFFLVFTNASAQNNNTVTADELIDFFTPQKEAIEKGQDQPGSEGRRGVGGIRQGHSGSQSQGNAYNYEPQYLPPQPSQNIQQTSPQGTQHLPQQAVPQIPQSGMIKTEPEARRSFQNILFDVNAYTLKESSYPQLDEIGKALSVVMAQNTESFFIIEGHTDSMGSSSYNEKLSNQRAQIVKDFLLFKYSLDNKRLMAVGYGENRPIASNDNEYGRSMNRRVEVVKR